MELKNLYTLKTILEEGSFGRAASKLGYTQSTITFQMRQLQEELGVQLFEKIGRRMVFTQAGESVLPLVKETIAAYERLQNAGRQIVEMKGELNIILSETLLCYKMKEVIREFHIAAPGIKLKLRSLGCHETKQVLIDGNADIGICYDEGEDDERLQLHSLGQCSMSLVASTELAKQLEQKGVSFEAEHMEIPVSFITDEPNGIFRLKFEQYIRENDVSMDSTIELWSTAAIKSMVMTDLGVAYLPTYVVQEEIAAGVMKELSHYIINERFRVIYACHKNKYLSPQVLLFMELLEKHVRFDD